MTIRRSHPLNRIFEFYLPLLLISLLPFLNGGWSELGRVIFLSFVSLYLLLFLRGRRKLPRLYLPICWTWVVFLFVAFISAFFSISLTYSLPKFFELLGIFLYFFLFLVIVDRPADLGIFSASVVLVGAILSLISLFYVLFPPSSLPGINLVYASFGHNHLSDYLMFVLPIIVAVFLRQKKRHLVFFSGLLVVFFFINFYLTFARAAIFIASLLMLTLVWMYKPTLKKVAFLLFLVLVPFIFILTFLGFSDTKFGSRIFETTIHESSWLRRQIIKPFRNDGRLEYWQQAYKGFQLRPLFGNGPGTFRITSSRFRNDSNVFSWFAHNSFLQAASEMGIFGLLAFGTLIFLSFSTISPSRINSPYAWPLFLGGVGSFVQSLVDFNFEFPAIFLLFWVIMAMLIKLSTRQPQRVISFNSKRIILPISLILLLFVMTVLVSSYSLSLAKKQEPSADGEISLFHRLALLLPSLDERRFTALLSLPAIERELLTSQFFGKVVIFWNREDPAIYQMLAKIHDPSAISLLYYKKALSLSSYLDNILLIEPIFRYYASDREFVVEAFLDLLRTGEFSSLAQQFSALDSSQRSALAEHILAFYDPNITEPPQLRWWASKVFYFTGLGLFEQGEQEQTALFWDWARIISPDWDLFSIEASALSYHVQYDRRSARTILTDCLQNRFARESCQNQLNLPLDYLPEPGTQKDRIHNIGY